MTMRRRMRVAAAVGAGALLAAVMVGVPAVTASATTWTVAPAGGGGQFTSIQAAINAARNGDTVSVAAGTYREAVTVNKYITLTGQSAASTVIRNPGGAAEVVFVTGVPYTTGLRTVIQNFSIADGNAPDGHGGGMTLYNADAEVVSNVFDSNHASNYGGALAILNGSDAVVRGNTFNRNSAVRGGGAIFAGQGSNPNIAQNTFADNSSSGWSTGGGLGGSSGGAIYLESTSGPIYPVVINNTFSNNTADFAGGGVMLRVNANAVVEGNTFTGNRASYGGAIHSETGGANVKITANNIANNAAPANSGGAAGYGGGIAIFDHSNVTMTGNVITGNRSSTGGGGVVIDESANLTAKSNTLISNGTDGNDGGAFYIANATATIYNSVIARNSAKQGSAIAVETGGIATVLNNTIASNNATNSPGGAVFFVTGAGDGAVVNNIFSANSNYQLYEEAVHSVKRNNLFAPGTRAYYGTSVGGAANSATDLNNLNGRGAKSSGNLSGDPAFSNAGGDDYSLTRASAAIDQATTADAAIYPTDDRRNAIRATGTVDVGAYEYETSPIIKSPVYRFWSTTKSSHFYTQSSDERNSVAANYVSLEWRYEGVAYDAFSTQVPGSVALYRFFSPTFGGHFYTANEYEKDQVKNNYPSSIWTFEGPAFYVYPLDYSGNAQTVWRFWSPDNKHHFYTASDYERDVVRNTYPDHVWTYENGNFKVPRS